MANVALLGSCEVTRGDTSGAVPIVAAATIADHIGMINPDHRSPRATAMAILAKVTGVDMAAVFSRCRGTVVTTDTISGVICVIEISGHPCRGRVTKIAGIVTGDMGRRLAGRGGTIVTAMASANDIRVIDPDHWSPGRIAVAVLTDIASLDMGTVLAGCCGSIMAT